MSARTKLTRLREKASTDRAALDALLDSVLIGHFGLTDTAGRPVVVPTAFARDGDRVLLHGSTGSPWMRRLADGTPACLTVTALDGLVVARSAFESSMRYRSAVVFGTCAELPGAEVEEALDLITEKLLPGRAAEIRRPTARELKATRVLAMPLVEWSLKISDKWPEDPEDDVAGPAWAGIVPLVQTYGAAEPAPDLRPGIPAPPSLTALSAGAR